MRSEKSVSKDEKYIFLRELYCRKTVSKIAASNGGYGRLRFLLKAAVTVTVPSVRFPSQHYNCMEAHVYVQVAGN
jgi:hypothetical protein